MLKTLAAVLATAAVILGLSSVPAYAASARYVDCSAAAAGTGSQASPYNSLAAVNALTLAPGDQVLFKRGATCTGQFAPTGAGSAAAPVVIGGYGTGTARPVIAAGGRPQAILLNAFPYVTVQDLELTATGDNTTARRGVYVYAADAGEVSGITLRNLSIHDVRGALPLNVVPYNASTGKFAGASGGIIVEAQGSTTPTFFHDLKILDNTITAVDRQGIYTWSNWCQRPELASIWATACTAPWTPGTDLLISGNDVGDVGGDGIVVKGYDGALVEHNKVDGFSERGLSPNAGIWTANTVNATFQYNEAAHGKGILDGQGYDVDHSTSDIVFQYNFSHDNEGGFFLLCPYNTPTQNFTIRYNISVDDHTRTFHVCNGSLVNGKIYNNTIYIGNWISPSVLTETTSAPLDLTFTDNIIRKDLFGIATWNFSDSGITFDHNLIAGLSVPSGATNTITGPAGFVSPGTVTPEAYRLKTGSPAIDAGVPVTGNGGLDYFGTILSPTDTTPDIGAYEGPGL